tara:strand:- start:28524 stop:28886 length:363 start_codon:yes stop_codon:yes gene_type:complete
MKTIREQFDDWVDFDVAAFIMGATIGLFEEDSFIKNKGIFWTSNPTGDILFDMLEHLVANDMLIKNDDMKFKWNDKFAGLTWTDNESIKVIYTVIGYLRKNGVLIDGDDGQFKLNEKFKV